MLGAASLAFALIFVRDVVDGGRTALGRFFQDHEHGYGKAYRANTRKTNREDVAHFQTPYPSTRYISRRREVN
jgi:hypothetical protein